MDKQNILLNLSNQEHLELIYLLWHNWLQKIPSSKLKEYKLEEYQKVSLDDLQLLQAQLEKNLYYSKNSKLNLFIAASTVPITPFKEILNSLLLKTPIICRLPQEFDFEFYKLFEQALPNDLKNLVQFVSWPSNNTKITQEFINKSDCIIVHGSNETINSLKFMSVGKHFLGFGHKASFVVCKPNLSNISALVEDIEAFEQRGCLSPQVIYCLETNKNQIINFGQHLNNSLEKAFANFPIDSAQAYAKQNFLEQISLEAHNQIIGKHLVFSENPQFEYSLGGGLIWLKPLKNLFGITKAVDRLNGFIGAIGTDLPESLIKEFFYKVRICELGQMQKPSLFWLQEPTHYNLNL